MRRGWKLILCGLCVLAFAFGSMSAEADASKDKRLESDLMDRGLVHYVTKIAVVDVECIEAPRDRDEVCDRADEHQILVVLDKAPSDFDPLHKCQPDYHLARLRGASPWLYEQASIGLLTRNKVRVFIDPEPVDTWCEIVRIKVHK